MGVDPDETYAETVILLDRMESFLLYTDGIVEQRNRNREMFCFDRLGAQLLFSNRQVIKLI